MVFYGADGYSQVFSDFCVRPPAACEHGDTEFGGSEVACHVRTRLEIVQAPPSFAETVGDVDYACVVLGIVFFQARFEHALQKPMVLADFFNEAVGQGMFHAPMKWRRAASASFRFTCPMAATR